MSHGDCPPEQRCVNLMLTIASVLQLCYCICHIFCKNANTMSQTETQLLEAFRFNLRRIRTEQNLSQSDLARRINKSASYVCDIERNRRSGVTLRTVACFAHGLRVAPSELLVIPAVKTTFGKFRRHRKYPQGKEASPKRPRNPKRARLRFPQPKKTRRPS